MPAVDQKSFASFKPGDEVRLTLPTGGVVDVVFHHAGRSGVSFEPNTRGRSEHSPQGGMFFYDALSGVAAHPNPTSLSAETHAKLIAKANTISEGAPIHFVMKDGKLLTMAYHGTGGDACRVEPISGRTVGNTGGLVYWHDVASVHTDQEFEAELKGKYYPRMLELECFNPTVEETSVRIELNDGRVCDATYCHHGYGGMSLEPFDHGTFPTGFMSWDRIRRVTAIPTSAI